MLLPNSQFYKSLQFILLFVCTCLCFATGLQAKDNLVENVVSAEKIYTVRGKSMLPTLQPGDQVTINSQSYFDAVPQVNDLVAVRFSSRAHPMVKRVVATANDEVKLDTQGLWRNGKLIPNVDTSFHAGRGKALQNQLKHYQGKVPNGHVILLGDNPKNSRDSFRYGFISIIQIEGKVVEIKSNTD